MICARLLPLGCALLIGACLGSTDAGPTLTLLKELGDTIPKKVKGIIKFESAVNDPAALVMFSIILQLFFTSGEVDTASGLRQAAEDLFEAFKSVPKSFEIALMPASVSTVPGIASPAPIEVGDNA